MNGTLIIFSIVAVLLAANLYSTTRISTGGLLATMASKATHPQYELLYHPTLPGRGEYIRLAFEVAGVPYTDLSNEDEKNGYKEVQKICMSQGLESDVGNPPTFAVPALRVPGAGVNGNSLVISQTRNILIYLGDRLGLAPDDERKWHVQQLMMTALDLQDEIHNTHHPIASGLYYEDQKAEALVKARDLRELRLPKFFSYFERNLKFNKEHHGGQGKYLVGDKLTYADTTLWQVLDGSHYAFPKEMAARKAEYPDLLDTFYESVKNEKGIKEYLASNRRLPYGLGIFRKYPELDRQ